MVKRMNMSIDEIINQVICISKKYNIEYLYLFGSYATGTATPTSDIDFVVQGIRNKFDYLDEIDKIRTLKTIDIFDYDKCTNEFLNENIAKYGKQLY